eukprot:TRINITY_DN4079_c0_g1_i5.p1 TRINITY_DN4079_c0_g1~~TRINITY_DN4079_c0_g1_i5.p1  ORF type:complete len:282 (-),score=41.90 TRINITY_DN4079_c0_g1_i5:7-852(-)
MKQWYQRRVRGELIKQNNPNPPTECEMDNNNKIDDVQHTILVGCQLLKYWFSVVNNEQFSWSVHMLNKSTVIKPLVLVSKDIAETIKPFTEKNFWFFQTRRGLTNAVLHFYSPKKLRKVQVIDFEQFPCLKTITHLSFDTDFNEPIDNLLPHSVVYLNFRTTFNQSINYLPPNLTSLKLSDFFNQPISNMLPLKLTHLQFGLRFNHPIDGILPPDLKFLHFEYVYNHPLNQLPLKLSHLTIGGCFNHPLLNLPPSLTHLTLPKIFDKQISAPASLKCIKRV